LDDIAKENDVKKITMGTAAELVEGTDWFIEVPNGKYDIKIILKLVDNKINKVKYKDKLRMDFRLNEVEIKTEPMDINNEMVHSKPNINVTKGEIRLKWT